jgi:hypothetical protein
MTREELKEKLFALSCLLDEIESKADDVMHTLCLAGKGDAVYEYLQSMHFDDARRFYDRLTDDKQAEFRKAITPQGESK